MTGLLGQGGAAVKFKLSPEFVAKYATRKAPFGFNGLGELVYLRTYSRTKEDGTNEVWYETVQRVVEGTYSMQKRWVLANHLPWHERKAQRSAEEMYERMFTMKFLPPGRGLWAMGSPLTEERGLYAALNNCAFVSTDNLAKDKAEPFVFLMDASMLGIGVGFDTKGAGMLQVNEPGNPRKVPLGAEVVMQIEEAIEEGFLPDSAMEDAFFTEITVGEVYVIPDTREGWVESLRRLLDSYFVPEQAIARFDYSAIRPEGAAIKGFGGKASGAGPLQDMHEQIRAVLDSGVNQPITVTAIVDIMNIIGKCVVAGNVRRTAEIAFGDASDEYMDLKDYSKNPHRESFGWTSNNSIFAEIGMDYSEAAKRVAINGEPGFAWLDNMRRFGRMSEPENNRDRRAKGGNPCLEQTLESYELCCLVETFPDRHETYEDYRRTLKFAYLYAKTVTLGGTPWPRTNAVMFRNRRIGLSMGGIQTFIAQRGIEEFRGWCDRGYEAVSYYDEKYSDWLAIPRSVKMTSVKPGGTVPLLPGCLPGMHWPEAKHWIRRMRLSKFSELVQPLVDAGYLVEPCFGDDSSVVVEIPVKGPEGVRSVAQVSMWEQLEMAAFMQEHWADNQVSVTVTFNPETEGPQIASALNYFQYRLKGVSFLPRPDLYQEKGEAPYRQMPYEAITEDVYNTMVASVRPVDFGGAKEEAETEKYCDSDHCVIG